VTPAATLPSGHVTFVLTDIEGSTKLFRRLGDAYPPLLETHNALLREQWAAHGGAEVKTVGDAFIVAFESAADAMVASVAAQQAMTSHRWPSEGVMRIRVGVHAGMAFARDGDYVALALHQAARVVNAASGGQVIASDDAVAAAGDRPGVRFQPIGSFRLRDFERPVRLTAVRAAGDPGDGPVAVRAVPADGHNLMTPTTSFVGRDDDVADLAGRLAGGRVVTIVGPGGMGKTRLAVEVGLRVAPVWPDGVWFVDLSTVGDPRLVAAAVAEAVGAAPGDGEDEREAVIAHLASGEALVILDNCEHVLAAAGELVGRLGARCGRVGVLTTSRVPLTLPGEVLWRIEPLAIVEDAVRLFAERACARVPGFTMSPADEAIVTEICRHLDGMPLAIELAATRLSVLSPAEILDGLKQRFRLLRTNDPTAAPRQRSLQALLGWSQALLTADEQAVFGRLSVFRAAFDLDAAAAAAGFGVIDPDDVADVVWSLADESLLVVDRSEGHTRYRMLETIRAYAADRLDDTGDAPVTRLRLAGHYLAHDSWASVTSRTNLSALALEADTAGALVDGLFVDGRDDDALALARIVAVVQHMEGRLALALDGLEGAIARSRRGSTMLARAHLGAHIAAASLGRLDVAQGHVDQVRRLVVEHGPYDRWGYVSVARAEADLAMRSASRDDMTQAVQHLRAELEDDLNDFDRADLLVSMGEIEGDFGHADAVPVLNEAVETLRRFPLGDGALAAALCSLAEYEARIGDDAAAARHQQESMYLAADLGFLVPIGHAFVLAARLAERIGLNESAIRLHGAADVLYEDAGFELLAGDQALSDAMRSRVRAQLGAERVDALTREGRALDRQRAIGAAEEVFGRAGA
jgi:predicted ATPase/class 3 adenylate cyclase